MREPKPITPQERYRGYRISAYRTGGDAGGWKARAKRTGHCVSVIGVYPDAEAACIAARDMIDGIIEPERVATFRDIDIARRERKRMEKGAKS